MAAHVTCHIDVVQVDVGSETRQVCAGLRQFLTPEELQGKLVGG